MRKTVINAVIEEIVPATALRLNTSAGGVLVDVEFVQVNIHH